ncbi:MAG TPA: choice-of-anchor tandem repeat GloVer-containing protein [Terriglobales bacterium]|jgi:uncharacterized repeat protein (TIGR03803 family)|nr:choice-of-anchor tandem repeat GloVer-containing protein [Terriglobales bacterium]
MSPTISAIRLSRFLMPIALLIFVSSAFAANENVVYRFKGGNGYGASPYAAMVADKQGNLYGTTSVGGNYTNCAEGCGTIFELSPPAAPGAPWTETVLFDFDGTNGADPLGSLILDQAGNLYGATASGGIANCYPGGCGVIFELSPPSQPGGSWTESVLYSFFGATDDGGNPSAGLVMDLKGNLYGTTRYGGSYGLGTAFQLSPPAGPGGLWTETILHVFGGPNDGAQPVAALTLGLHGAIYGVTYTGSGNSQFGTAFKLKPPTQQGGSWTELIMYHFSGGIDGSYPLANMIIDKDGNLYGTASSAGQYDNGVVFEISPTNSWWVETVLYAFTNGTDGSTPAAGVIADKSGNLYGTTNSGGEGRKGSVFELSPGSPWTETTLHDFLGDPDGEEPNAGLTFDRGHLFGTTPYGGYGVGALFAIGP